MAWNWTLHDTLTGTLLRRVAPTGVGSWKRRANSKGGDRHTFLLPAPDAEPDDPAYVNAGLWFEYKPYAMTLVCSWDRTPVYAGLVIDREYDRQDRSITLKHEDLWSILEDRFLFNNNSSEPIPKTEFTYSGLSSRALIARMVFQAMTGPGGMTAGYRLPVTYPSFTEAGTMGIELYGFDAPVAESEIQKIIEADGPDVDFVPRFSEANTLTWELQVWRTRTALLEVNVDAPDSQVSNLTLQSSGRFMATEVHYSGNGSGDDVVWSRRFDPTPDGVARAVKLSDQTLRYSGQVAAAANVEYAQRNRTIHQTGMRLNLTGPIKPTDLELGMTIRFHTFGDPVWQDGPHDRILIGWGPTGPNEVELELAENPVLIP